MRHIPHLCLGEWEDEHAVAIDPGQAHHLRRVLRIDEGAEVTYTNGLGVLGSGIVRGELVERGEESFLDPPPVALTVAVAPPSSNDRTRFLVEKLCELGVRRIIWLRSRHGRGRVPSRPKTASWALAALEQSRGAWLTHVDESITDFEQIPRPLLVAHQGGTPPPAVSGPVTIAVGPEGGWADGEIPEDATILGLGDRVLRVETAALVAAARLLG